MDSPAYRVVLIGNGTIAVRGLFLLRELGIDVPLVLADPKDSGKDTWRLSLLRAATALGFEKGRNLFAPEHPNEPRLVSLIAKSRPTLLLSLQCRRLIKNDLISIPTRAVVNLHNAPLPLLRGCDPFSWAIHDGLTKMGLSLHKIVDEGVDSGPIYSQCFWDINDTDSAWDLYTASISHGEKLLRDCIAAICSGALEPSPQSEFFASYHCFGQFPFDEREVSWSRPALALSRWVRSRIFPPLQLPFFKLRDRAVSILECRCVSRRGRPSEVLSLDPLIVSARQGSLQLSRLSVDGVECAGDQWARDFGLKVGMCIA